MKKNSDAVKLAKLMNGKDVFRSVSGMLGDTFKGMPEDTLEKILAIFERKSGMDELIDDATALYVKYYTPSEIKGLLKFYTSKLGKRHRKIALETAAETLAIGTKWGQKIIASNLDEIRSILEEIDFDEMESRGFDEASQNRVIFAINYAKSKGWDLQALTAEQAIEIREQEEWKNLGGTNDSLR